MTKHQYQALSGQVSGWALLILGTVSEKPWVAVVCYALAFFQMLLNCYWHYKVTEKHETQTP